VLVYALLLAAAGVGSIYAYEAHVENQNLELTALVTMVPLTAETQRNVPERAASRQPRAAANTDSNARTPMRTINQGDVTDMRKPPTEVGVTGNNVPPMLPGAEIGPRNIDVGGFNDSRNPNGNGGGTAPSGGNRGGGGGIIEDTPPEMTRVESRPPKPRAVQSLGVIESKVIRKAVPPYPELARRARASGAVTVQILLDEQGKVVSARATNGHPLLRAAAEQAAYQTKFSPTLLSNQPVKVSGIITFNFILQ
jgi:TonB family protein